MDVSILRPDPRFGCRSQRSHVTAVCVESAHRMHPLVQLNAESPAVPAPTGGLSVVSISVGTGVFARPQRLPRATA